MSADDQVFEWQAVLAARLLAGRAKLPPVEEQRAWEEERIRALGDGPAFMVLAPNFEEYFEKVRALAGDGAPGLGRKLPPFRQEWLERFHAGHEKRKGMWRRLNAEAVEAPREARL